MILFSSFSHLPKSTSLHRFEQNGPYGPSNQWPSFLQVGHLTARGIAFAQFRGALPFTQYVPFHLNRVAPLALRAEDVPSHIAAGTISPSSENHFVPRTLRPCSSVRDDCPYQRSNKRGIPPKQNAPDQEESSALQRHGTIHDGYVNMSNR